MLHRSAQSAQHVPDEDGSDSLCAVYCFDSFQRACNSPRLPAVFAVRGPSGVDQPCFTNVEAPANGLALWWRHWIVESSSAGVRK